MMRKLGFGEKLLIMGNLFNMRIYRSELDGLRAFAVLSVIIYHAELTFKGFSILPGGFLGVDIFFVLSGFLITGILIDKSPTLFQFYKSRIDRIYPALLLMLLLSCILAYIYLIPSDILNFTEQLKGAVAFYSNYIFMYEDSYVSDSSQYKVLLHTWSLGVEWQYYLAFPFIIYGIKKFFSSQFEQILIILFAVSFFYCLYLMSINNTFAFYSTFSRVWELFAGGIVFLISKHLKDNKFDNLLSAISLVIIAYCLLFFKDADAHPGFISLLAVLGATLFILFTKEDSFVYKISTLKISIFFGVISYSLYLYHQPILVFYRFSQGEITNKVFLALFVLMILVSYLSYRFFENPIRRSKSNKKYLILIFFTLFIIAFYKGAKYTEGYNFRQPEIVKEALRHFEGIEFIRLVSEIHGLTIDNTKISRCIDRTPATSCRINNDGKKLLVLGDSFAGSMSYILSEQKNLNINFITMGQCPFLKEGIWFGNAPECPDINKLRWIEIEKMEPTNVLIGINFEQFTGAKKEIESYIPSVTREYKELVPKELVFQDFRESIEKLIFLGHNPIVLLQPPSPTIDVAKELKRKVSLGVLSFKEEYSAVPTTNIDNEVRNALKGLNVTFIDMNAKMCKDDKCLTFNKNGGLYNLGGHLSYFGAQLFVEDIINSLK
ncbi:acyltransferase family protein [Arcobacter aquimarinus]|uniref:acyltransferase family protein n=1 Tax=Arcobacter aquimarinus TaxID=1315211 RepID=UPI003BB196AE